MLMIGNKSPLDFINELSLFEGFSEKIKEHLGEISSLESFADDDVIIKEGCQFDTPLILLEGEVNIFKNNNFVDSISEKGSLLGEISFASPEKISCAKVVAEGKVLILSFNGKYLKEVLGINTPSITMSCLIKFAQNNIGKIEETNLRVAKLTQRKRELEESLKADL